MIKNIDFFSENVIGFINLIVILLNELRNIQSLPQDLIIFNLMRPFY